MFGQIAQAGSSTCSIYNVFHVSLLQPAMNDPFLSQLNDDYQPPPKLVNGEAEYAVKEILEECEK
ncbi:uncharacterized protein NFIA_005680 [Aspergillus fischeri NRRL 181]|uniref:Uncharacterized protein n=1 Tax=Neosartorya fischeri (strain ATCC 1020 / DSM 3700 / CBS 544.65 / FGSC A1164 / JCM 1740 / NRRL 181 / WB 181) TaxID=331117 RepID=A1DKG6_NEOFI|nr:uncharacterized protein NFIA_005680 [Aspergillus fischeri NRRL 181]EAW17205.1 hypothetical protein NFIA_005680 [Aspergillus fischeri NRRL 181]KAG2004122.1 hypothetical protein GB937_009139 [Aspergillus fischeri]